MSTVLSRGKPLAVNFSISDKISFLHGQLDLGRWLFPLHSLLFNDDGQAVCPCHLGEKCPGPGKHPLIRWSTPFDPSRPRTYKQIEELTNAHVDWGWGMHCGLSGLCVLDIDPKNGGDESFDSLCREYGLLLGAPTVRTGSGGRHYYFNAPILSDARRGFVGRNMASRTSILLRPGVEIFFGQHYVVLPFSPHRSGQWYRLESGNQPTKLPDALLRLANESPAFVSPEHRARHTPSQASERRSANFQPDLERARKYVATIPGDQYSKEGPRFTAYIASVLIIDFGLPYDDAFRIFSEWNARYPPCWTDEELRRKLDWAESRPGPRGVKGACNRIGISPSELAALDRLYRGMHIWTGLGLLNMEDGRIVELRQPPPDPKNDTSDIELIDDRGLPTPLQEISLNRLVPPKGCCLFKRHIAQYCEELHSAGILHVCCQRRTCSYCKAVLTNRLRQAFIMHLSYNHGANLNERAGVLYRAYVATDRVAAITKAIRRQGGDFIRLDYLKLGSNRGAQQAIISNRRTPGIAWERIWNDDAITWLSDLAKQVDSSAHGRVYFASKAWRLPKEEKESEVKWKNFRDVHSSLAQQRAVFAAYGLELKFVHGTKCGFEWAREEGRFDMSLLEELEFDLREGYKTGVGSAEDSLAAWRARRIADAEPDYIPSG